MPETVRCRCIDETRCGRVFEAHAEAVAYCPYCRELAAPIDGEVGREAPLTAGRARRSSTGSFAHWRASALANVDDWGVQSPEVVLLAMMEELGEVVQARLEHRHEDGEFAAIQRELDDLAPLCWQLQWALEQEVTIES